MTLALGFITPLLLLGVLAAGIPFVLHMLSSVRAQEVYFPTLRFLRMSMEKTARRRRIQHWLLLGVRASLLALLALAVAEPISRATGGWLTGKRYAAVIILDNSLSMASRAGGTDRLSSAKNEAASLLGGDHKPALAAVLTTNGGLLCRQLTSRLEPLRKGIATASAGAGRAPIAQRVAQAVGMLKDASAPQKSIYVFSDLQRVSFEELIKLKELQDHKDIHLLVVNTAKGKINNVGLADLRIEGQRIVDQTLEFTAVVVNSCPTDRVVDVALRVGGKVIAQRVRKVLRRAGKEGSSTTVRFYHPFKQPGPAAGEVFLDLTDDLAADNVRRFSLTIGGRIRALVVPGGAAGQSPWLSPATMLRLALDPYEDASAPWSVRPRIVASEAFQKSDLAKTDVAFFCNVPAFTDAQGCAIVDFTLGGGSAVFFLGPNVQADKYNKVLVQDVPIEGGLLPARLTDAVGEVGPEAQAKSLQWVDVKHPYFAGLFPNPADYLGAMVQRHYRLARSPSPPQVLMRLTGGEPLLLVKRFGRGRVVLCTTTASPRWSNLPVSSLFLPVVARISLLARRQFGRDNMYLPDAQVTIRPDGMPAGDDKKDPQLQKATVKVLVPGREDELTRTRSVALRKQREGYVATFSDTSRVGVYQWRVARAQPRPAQSSGGQEPLAAGSFVINPHGIESKLAAFDGELFRKVMNRRGLSRVYTAASLEAVNAAAAGAAKGRNWWDIALAAVILLLTVEAVVANRMRRPSDQVIPAHLNPRIAA